MKNVGILLIHGFCGNVGEVRPMADYLTEKGFETYCPKLEGHTGRRKDLKRSAYADWIISAEEGLLKLKSNCRELIIIGFSMGGLIAINLAEKYEIKAIATLSTPISYLNKLRIIGNIFHDIMMLFKKASGINSEKEHLKNIRNYIRAVKGTPFSAYKNFKSLLFQTIPVIKHIKCPIFVAQGMKDDAVIIGSAEYIYNNVQSGYKSLKYYGESGHWICLDNDNNKLFEDFFEFSESLDKEAESYYNTCARQY